MPSDDRLHKAAASSARHHAENDQDAEHDWATAFELGALYERAHGTETLEKMRDEMESPEHPSCKVRCVNVLYREIARRKADD